MKKQILHLGCGNNKLKGAIGVDILRGLQADVIHNLDKFPYPFKTNQFDEIYAKDIIEHLENIPRVMQELHRIGKNGAKLTIITGHFTSVDAFTDPTHKHFFTSRTFDYFIPKTDLFKYQYSKATYKKLKVFLGPEKPTSPLLVPFLKLVNQNVVFWEKHFSFLFPTGTITYELQIIKNGKDRN